MAKRGIADDVWDVSFNHFLALVVSQEILACLASIAQSKCSAIDLADLAKLDFSSLGDFHADTTHNMRGASPPSEEAGTQLPGVGEQPAESAGTGFPAGKDFLLAVLQEARRQLPVLTASRFFVYIDEYENLREYQQRHINTYLKHSEPPLIFNIATKRNGIKTRKTVGDESITDIADYRTHDLDEYARRYSFQLYAAEILFLRFATMANVHPLPVDVDRLPRSGGLDRRRSTEYARSVIWCG